ncbi:FAD-binding oxidoreductase [Acinetobacter sp. R933-2]|uniref:NAD(P)/FAD-dependent oxidoreductase n=1 Tax=Acinetobacter sp. R933-2 TaxID=2746728 RepID=UPI002579173C|nr:FAD-binding oxidoreductase [Acinetobacter sp. R933-2]MDM1247734.1 FAD-binding oxidoreductase [Acinetobacter sp. R933-2]
MKKTMISDTALNSIQLLPQPRHTALGVLRSVEVKGTHVLPQSADVVIIGAGICGVLSAYYLAKQGKKVVVCDKGEIACESSSKAFGWVSQLLTSEHKVKLTRRSKYLWRALQQEIGELGYREQGITYFAESAEEFQSYQDWLTSVQSHVDPDIKILQAHEVSRIATEFSGQCYGAITAPTDGCIEPVLTTAAIAEAAKKRDVIFVTQCAVRGLDLQAKKVHGVFTEKGYIQTSQVISAVNTWTRIFCAHHHIDVPQLYVIMSMGRVEDFKDSPMGCGGKGAFAWRKQIDGGYSLGLITGMSAPITRDAMKLYKKFLPIQKMLGGSKGVKVNFGQNTLNDWKIKRTWNHHQSSPFETHRSFTGAVDLTAAETSKQLMSKFFPHLKTKSITESWSGTVAFTQDNAPIASAVNNIEGFYVLMASGYGFSWGPALAEMLSDLLLKQSEHPDLHTFRLSRFSDGTTLEPQL